MSTSRITVKELVEWGRENLTNSDDDSIIDELRTFAAHQIADLYLGNFKTKDFADLILNESPLPRMADEYDLQRWLDEWLDQYSNSGDRRDATRIEYDQAWLELTDHLGNWFHGGK